MGHWVANQQIRYGGALAYNTGQYVPASNVDKHGYDKDDLVDWVDSDARTDVAPTLPDGPPFEGWIPVTHADVAAAELDASRAQAAADIAPPTDTVPETSGDDTTTTEV